MYVKKIKNRSNTTSVIVSEKISGKYKQLTTIGISSKEHEINQFVKDGQAWIQGEERRRYPELDFNETDRKAKEQEYANVNQFISQIDNIVINGTQLILDRVFDGIGVNQIDDNIFRHLVLSRLSFPASKAATVEYLKNCYDEDFISAQK